MYSAAFGFNYAGFEIFTLIVEIIFVIDILMSKKVYSNNLIKAFITEYISEEDYFPVRDLKKIGVRYIQ